MKRKKLMIRPLALALVASQCMTSFAGVWVNVSNDTWAYVRDDGTKQPGGWFTDPADQKIYYLDESGAIAYGWRLIDNVWYFFNTMHDGAFGSAVTSRWQWIDGYSYLFNEKGQMYMNTTTPDGFTVNENGQWTENGKAVYVAGKGIITHVLAAATNNGVIVGRVSGGGGGGSSSGGSSGGSTSQTTYYSYTVRYVDESGNVLSTDTGKVKKNTFITITNRSITGYEPVGDDAGKKKVTEDGAVFTVRYKKTEEAKPDTKPDTEHEDTEKTYHYTVQYVDRETEKVLRENEGDVKPNETVTVEDMVDGYTPCTGNTKTFTVTEDDTVITLYFEKEKEKASYTIKYVDENDRVLRTVTGKDELNKTILIPEQEIAGFTRETEDDSFTLTEDGYVFIVRYTKDEVTDKPATGSEVAKKRSYTITFIDRDTNGVLMRESGTVAEGTELVPTTRFEGYEYADSYHFTVSGKKNNFKVYLVRLEEPEEKVNVKYTVTCEDEAGKTLKVFNGSVLVGDEPVEVKTNYVIDGYEPSGDTIITVEKEGSHEYTLTYRKTANATLHVTFMDIDTMQEIDTTDIDGVAGDSVDISGLCPDGYEPAGNLPDSVKLSSNDKNNVIKLYYKKIKEIEDVKKKARYTIQFRAQNDHSVKVMDDVTGTWTVGEKMSYYFLKTYNDKDGNTWTAVDDSPSIFTADDQEMNTFCIEFVKTGEEEVKDLNRSYSIKYVAEDTGSTLGISTGFAKVGDKIPYVNTHDSYGFKDTAENYYTIKEDGDNKVEVILKRNKFPAPVKNENTGKYDGFEWLALFVDSNGQQLLPNVSGFTLKGDRVYFKYPDVIERDGVTYRAVKSSPYIEYVNQTTYRQFVIQYVTGEPSEDKLANWKQKAQEKKDEFYGTTPYHYFVAFREKNSWNDIGLQFNLDKKDANVMINELDIPGWNPPEENLGSFTLDTDGKTVVAQYEKPNEGNSVDYIERQYTIRIVDEDGNDIFPSYTGKIGCVKGNTQFDFPVHFPKTFYDKSGNRWEADEDSPVNFVMNAMDGKNEKTIRYHRAYLNEQEQFVVTSNTEFNKVLNDFASHTNNSDEHDYYVLGRDYDTSTAEVSETMSLYNLAGYSNEVVDRFELNGVSYTISHVQFHRKWEQGVCSHEFEAVTDLNGSCVTSSKHKVRCKKCGEEVEVIVPAVGHKDKNHDGSCDVCGIRLSQNLGDQITVTWDSGTLGFGKRDYTFTCIDDNYNGTGKMLYIASEGITNELFTTYSNANTAAYKDSRVRQFLDDEFANGLSINKNLLTLDEDAVSMLTKAEYDHYSKTSENKFVFPSGTYLTRDTDEDNVTLTDGTTVTKEQASQYEVHPVILLDRSEDDSSTRSNIWNVGDLQAREIGGKLYLFRCVNANYMDKTNTDKSMAVFLCDTVIPASEGLGFDEADGTQSTRFFGSTNNYKYSEINKWLAANTPDNDNLVRTNIGIKNEYTGSSTNGLYDSVTDKSFNRFTRSNPQVMYSNFFIPSLEEAIAMKDYLWKFNRSDENNADDIVTKYRSSYWLRTPEYGTDDMVYTVNMQTGSIEPHSVKATEGNDLCEVGIRPMYVMYQNY